MFFELYAATAKAVKNVDPEISFGGFGDNAFYQEHYVDFFTYAKANHVPIDFLTIHWYGDWNKQGALQPELYNSFAVKLLTAYQKFFGRKVPIFYSEWNLPAESVNQYPAARIAAFMSASLYYMQQNPEISGAAFFRIQHYRDPYSSLLDGKYNKKVPWRILKMFSLLPKAQAKAVSLDGDLLVLAGGNGKHLVAMLTRYQPDNEAVKSSGQIVVRGLTVGAVYDFSLYREDGAAAVRLGGFVPVETSRLTADGRGELTVSCAWEPYEVVFFELKQQSLN